MARGLGKIQKWILTEAYRRGERQLGEFKSYTKYYLSRQEIYNDYFNGFNRLNQTKLNDSQYGLKKRRLIRTDRFRVGKRKSGKIYLILTEKGIEKAKDIYHIILK